MGTAMFYHLTRSTPQQTLAMILPRALAQGWRVMLRSPDPESLDRLDAQLWLGVDDSFLPHGRAGADSDADQPILLGAGPIANGAQGLVLLDGAQTTPPEALALERVWALFDGADSAAVAQARSLWTALTSAGMPAQYWSEEAGKWEKKAEK